MDLWKWTNDSFGTIQLHVLPSIFLLAYSIQLNALTFPVTTSPDMNIQDARSLYASRMHLSNATCKHNTVPYSLLLSVTRLRRESRYDYSIRDASMLVPVSLLFPCLNALYKLFSYFCTLLYFALIPVTFFGWLFVDLLQLSDQA